MVRQLKRGLVNVDGISIRISDIKSCNIVGKYFPPNQNKIGKVQNYFSITTYSGRDFLSPATAEAALKKISKIYDIICNEQIGNPIDIDSNIIPTNEKQVLHGS